MTRFPKALGDTGERQYGRNTEESPVRSSARSARGPRALAPVPSSFPARSAKRRGPRALAAVLSPSQPEAPSAGVPAHSTPRPRPRALAAVSSPPRSHRDDVASGAPSPRPGSLSLRPRFAAVAAAQRNHASATERPGPHRGSVRLAARLVAPPTGPTDPPTSGRRAKSGSASDSGSNRSRLSSFHHRKADTTSGNAGEPAELKERLTESTDPCVERTIGRGVPTPTISESMATVPSDRRHRSSPGWR